MKREHLITILGRAEESEKDRKGVVRPSKRRRILPRRLSLSPLLGYLCCGFECGATGAHWNANGTEVAPTFSTSIVRSGSRSMRFNPSTQLCFAYAIDGGSYAGETVYVGRVYVYFASLPTANTSLIFTNSTGGSAAVGIGFHEPSSEIRTFTSNILVDAAFGASGVSVTTGVWYCVDFRLDQTPGARSADGRVDGIDLAQKTSANLHSVSDVLFLGNLNQATFDVYFDDFYATPLAEEYPIGAGYVQAYIPSADGDHNTLGCFSITDDATGSYLLLDELPMDEGAPTVADHVSQITTNADAYVEYLFAPVGSAPVAAPRCVDIVVGSHATAAGGGAYSEGLWKPVENGREAAHWGLGFFNPSGLQVLFSNRSYKKTPRGLVWTLDRLNNMRLRLGYGDADPDYHYDGIVIEAEFPE
jgi:hypothetical protein